MFMSQNFIPWSRKERTQGQQISCATEGLRSICQPTSRHMINDDMIYRSTASEYAE